MDPLPSDPPTFLCIFAQNYTLEFSIQQSFDNAIKWAHISLDSQTSVNIVYLEIHVGGQKGLKSQFAN